MAFPVLEREKQMSLILDALKKAKELTGRKSPAPPPTALASFRFGRPSRSERIRRIALFYVLPGLLIIAIGGYTANFWIKRLRGPATTAVVAPPPAQPDQAAQPEPEFVP